MEYEKPSRPSDVQDKTFNPKVDSYKNVQRATNERYLYDLHLVLQMVGTGRDSALTRLAGKTERVEAPQN